MTEQDTSETGTETRRSVTDTVGVSTTDCPMLLLNGCSTVRHLMKVMAARENTDCADQAKDKAARRDDD